MSWGSCSQLHNYTFKFYTHDGKRILSYFELLVFYRLPIVQGGSAAFLPPLFAIASTFGDCPTVLPMGKFKVMLILFLDNNFSLISLRGHLRFGIKVVNVERVWETKENIKKYCFANKLCTFHLFKRLNLSQCLHLPIEGNKILNNIEPLWS